MNTGDSQVPKTTSPLVKQLPPSMPCRSWAVINCQRADGVILNPEWINILLLCELQDLGVSGQHAAEAPDVSASAGIMKTP